MSGSYVYDRNGNLIENRHSDSGITHFGYDPLGRIQSATAPRIGLAQTFHYDPAHNLIDTPNTDPVHDNRISQYQNNHYRYDTFGNTLYRELADGTQHTYTYDLFDRMVSVRIDHPDNRQPQIWHYRYDALDRRIAKWRETETQEQTDKVEFIWDGSRLLQEIHPDRTDTYIYTEADSYEPLAQITNYTDPDKAQQIHYFHCDQIGIPRAMSDEAGNIVWRGQYDAWGKLLHEEKADGIHQPFRLQNQYYDQETGLHYNFFRYYDPIVGRFTQQDPIGLAGGTNIYTFAANPFSWIDPLGLFKYHGNWCGPDWTGGRKESYSKARDNSNYYSDPMGLLDIACKKHDICYAECREKFACSGIDKHQCMVNCDTNLVNTSKSITDDPHSSPTTRFGLERVISLNIGAESDINECVNYKMPNNIPSVNDVLHQWSNMY